jgi:hypothetical protein
MEQLPYWVKVNLYWFLFYACYWLLFRRHTFSVGTGFIWLRRYAWRCYYHPLSLQNR